MTTKTTTRVTKQNRFNGECKNCVNRGHRAVDCWKYKKYIDDDVYNLFVVATFCGEVS